MRKIALMLLLILITVVRAEWVNVNESSELFSYSSYRNDSYSLQFKLDGYEIKEFVNNNDHYTKISHPDQGSLLDIGMPELPVFTVFLAVPNTGKVEVEYQVQNSFELSDILIYPQQEIEDSSRNQDQVLRDEEYYSSGECYPQSLLARSNAAIMRDLRIYPITVTPFQYNASEKKLVVNTELDIIVNISAEKGCNEKDEMHGPSRVYDSMYRKLVINYDDLRDREELQPETILYIISDQDTALETLAYLTEWKKQKGFNVIVATTSETGTTSNSIKNYIQDAYDNWENRPDFVCFCGDAGGSFAIPSWSQGDHGYATLDGNDVLEDVILGRLSFENISTFQVLVSKILSYEKDPYLGNVSWYSSALLAGDTSISGPSMMFTCQSVKENMLDYPYGFNDPSDFEEIYSGSFPSQINNAINHGVSYMAYRGWLGMSGWDPGGNSNGYMMPFATLLTCGTGSWSYGTSDSESFMRQGTTTLPSGAIGAVGVATSGTHSCFNNALTLGIYGGIFTDMIYYMGGAVTMGKNYLYSTFPQNPGGYVDTYHDWVTLMGDPALELWTSVPQAMNALYNHQLVPGTEFFEINVEDEEGDPIAGALVCVSDIESEYFVTGYTDESGRVFLELHSISEGEYDFVVTCHNYIPVIETFEVIEAPFYAEIESVTYNDLNGNNDGVINPGETIEILATFLNSGQYDMIGIEASLELQHDCMDLQTTDIYIGDLNSGQSITLTTPIIVDIDESATGGVQGFLTLHMYDAEASTWTLWQNINVTGSNLWITDHAVSGGGIIEPGVETEIYFSLENMGSITAEDVTAELQSSNPRLMIVDNQGSFGNIDSGETGNNSSDTYTVLPSSLIVPGSQIEIELLITNNNGNLQSSTYLLNIGEVEVTDPLGPDAYGYWCFDDGDIGYDDCPEFDWIEIDGIGTDIPLNDGGDTGDVEQVSLPDDFHFSFYGIEYDEITVCSNGWIAPGVHEAANFMNHPIPGPQGVNPMIAVFWDDLDVNGSGDVLYYYDTDEHLFIIEWSDCHNGDTGVTETFEVILYDTQYYTTMTNDSIIKMQYLDINNNNAGSYPYNHGQFCTIGLESEGAETGLCYTFNNSYPDAAKTLEDEMAILFTPPQYPETGPYLELNLYEYISGEDQFIEAGESVIVGVTISNQGVDSAEDIVLELVSDDPYISIIQGTAEIDEMEPMEMIELNDVFSFEVAETVPDEYEFELTLEITSGDDLWTGSLSFTAHWIDAFYVEQDSIFFEIGLNQQNETAFTIENVSALPVNYYLRFNDESGGRDISGSYIETTAMEFEPGTEDTWNFVVYNNSPANEWVTDVWLHFPPGITVIDASDAFGGSGGDLDWDGITGDGVSVNWHGANASGWGFLHDQESAQWTVDVSIGDNFASDIQIGWEIIGDGYGEDPHIVTGELNLDFFINWISLNTSFGSIPAGDSEEITVFFDSNGMEPGDYECAVNILSDSWFDTEVSIMLTVNPTDDDDPFITPVIENCIVSPNPFNPSTDIRYTLADAGHTELNIYNLKGQKVKTLLNETLESGEYVIHWNALNNAGLKCSSGIYLLYYKTAKTEMIQKILLLK